MSGYPPSNQGYGYPGNPPPPQPYGSSGNPPPPQPYGSSGTNPPPYGSSPSSPYAVPYGSQPPPSSAPYGAPPSAPYASPPGGDHKPHKEKPQAAYGSPGGGGYGGHGSSGGGYGAPPYGQGGYGGPPPPPQQQQGGYGSPFASLVPSAFPPGTDPNIVTCFQAADRDNSGFIDDKELQGALSSYNQSFSMRTVHLLMYLFTNSNVRKIGPKEFTSLFYSLQSWRTIFERFDKDRSGRIDTNELRDALLSLGFSVSPVVLDLLVSKFDKSGGRNRAIEYDNFIECCLTVKGLTEKFKEKDTALSGSATFNYEAFMLTVLPFLVA
ncbi:unnamed protein product [Eruca vesicaria subsp. sativa]|uniref:EF-hand domain-containing protein n=1 Tax=Eruca vesicaria subsp. sativa TaxID=29727 RepID=A0ABC8KLG8_ERUVS|nr:unnamed protein product [Eruca vesicaria subsp. sativa]